MLIVTASVTTGLVLPILPVLTLLTLLLTPKVAVDYDYGIESQGQGLEDLFDYQCRPSRFCCEEVKWGNSYDSGKPKGPGCWSCIVAALRLWPHLELEEVCDLCEKDAKSADEIARAKDLLARQEENPFQPMSTVESNRVQGHEVYFKVAFLSESEMVKFLQVTPKALKLTEVTLELQQEGCTMRGYCVSLLDLPGEVRAVCHKVKIFSSTTIKLADTFLSPADQLSQHQGERTFTHLAKVQASRNPPAFRPLQKSSIPSYWDLKEKAAKLLEDRRKPSL